MKKSRTMIVVFLTPALFFFCLVFVYPILRTAFMSLFKMDNPTSGMGEWTFVGASNYLKLFSTTLFGMASWNIFRIWIFGGLGVMTLSLLFAVILNSGIRFKKFFRAVIYLPNVVSAVALATMWLQYVYHPRFGLFKGITETINSWIGGLNSLLSGIGIGGIPLLSIIQWTEPGTKFWALLIAYCFGMVGYHMLIFSSGIEKVPQEYYEAASIDGANKVSQFGRITWPLLRGVLKTNITMWTISSVGFFTWSQLFSTVTTDTSTITPVVYMYGQVFGAGQTITERNAGLGAAVGLLMGACVVVVFLLVNLFIRNDDLEF